MRRPNQPLQKAPAYNFDLTMIIIDTLGRNQQKISLRLLELEVKRQLPDFDLKNYRPIEASFPALMSTWTNFEIFRPDGEEEDFIKMRAVVRPKVVAKRARKKKSA